MPSAASAYAIWLAPIKQNAASNEASAPYSTTLNHVCDAISVLFIMYEPQSFMSIPRRVKQRSLTAYYPRTNNEHSNDQAFMREPP